MSTNLYDNPGGFRKGHDPRRAVGLRLFNGKTLAQMARESTPEALQMVLEVMRDEKARPADRLDAAKYILDRGWGKAVSVVHMETTETLEIRDLPRAMLLALAAGQTPSLPVTLDGEILAANSADDSAGQS